MSIRHALLLAVLSLLSTGCASIQSPTAVVQSASVRSISSEAVTLGIDIDLHNPNPVALPLSSADYTMIVGGAKLLDGNVQPTGSVPANGSLPVTIPVVVSFDDLLKVSDIIRRSDGELMYGLDGGVSVGSLMRKRVPFHYDGTLSLKEIVSNPKLLLSGGAVAKLARKLLGGYFGQD